MALALDHVLKSMVNSASFNNLPNKDWVAISRLLPGTTPKQCAARYEELLREQQPNVASGTAPGANGSVIEGSHAGVTADATEAKSSRPPSGKAKCAKQDVANGAKCESKGATSAEQSPIMVIHVCDEAKNVKKDFHCPRDLLVNEMKYFAEYLSTDAQRWEDVDISVHCDVQIFHWLMNYVKRDTRDVPTQPKLEPNNVISILISSDFLKMDSLVAECVQYCHANMNSIIATPCNMNCINDNLVSKIADLFTHNEADDIRDRKDKFKSKLFAKKVERLFDSEYDNSDSPQNAVTLFRCSVCRRLLTAYLECRVRCLPSRLNVDCRGKIVYSHLPDPAWDASDHVISLRSQVKSWVDVYWRLWGTVNALHCSRCDQTFPCTELGHCRYHPQAAEFDSPQTECEGGGSGQGTYSCCGEKMLRFDPTQPSTGCRVRDHVVQTEGEEQGGGESGEGEEAPSPSTPDALVLSHLLKHKEQITVPYEDMTSTPPEEEQLNVFGRDEALSQRRSSGTVQVKSAKSDTSLTPSSSKADCRPTPRLQALMVDKGDDPDEGESDGGATEEDTSTARRVRPLRRARVTVEPQAILLDAPDFSTVKTRKWDASRSLRWNQDAQREEDQRRMRDIVTYLTRLRHDVAKLERLRQREYAGGIYAKLESQWKSVYNPPPKAAGTLQRCKTRLTATSIKM